MTTTSETQTPAHTPGRPARLLDQATARLLKLPRPLTAYRLQQAVPVTARDGAVLATDHYAPITEQPRGTVLARGPYGRGFPGDLLQARVLAGQGYHVLNQSCRGTFGSSGRFDPMTQEFDDAQDTIAWLRTQPWFDGRLATFGGSYLGWTQWALLTDPPSELRTAVVAVGFHDTAEFAWGTGAFALNDALSWSEWLLYQERVGLLRGIVRQATAPRRLRPTEGRLPLADAADRTLQHQAPWFRPWLQHPDQSDPFWRPYRAEEALKRVTVPVMLVGGWQDLFLRQTLDQYHVLRDRGLNVGLTVGPWSHLQVGTSGIGIVMRGALDWLAEHLAAEPGRRRQAARVQIFISGAGAWRQLPEWPPPTAERRLYPQPGGRLAAGQPSEPGVSSSFTYDPADPTPSLGGRTLTADSGVKDNRAVETRADVLTFTTEPLTAPLQITGTPVVELSHSRDNPHADVSIRLCDVDPKGRSRNFSDGYLRLDPVTATGKAHIELALDPCAHRLAPGHRLRLQVAGGAHPRYGRNEGTGAPPGTGTELHPCTHTVHHGADALSQLILPTTPN
jgi:uncharacterized protein